MKNYLLSFLVLVSAFLLFFTLSSVKASHIANLSGWGWSDNIGWVSFNYRNCDPDGDGVSNGDAGCPAVGEVISDYGVNLDDATNNLSGYAWSENVGWLSFQATDISACPISPCQPKLDPGTGNLSGWAKFLNGSDSSGWDGWVRLAGDTDEGGSYAVHFNSGSGTFDGCSTGVSCAWGSDVVGWFDWTDVYYDDSPLPPDDPDEGDPQDFEVRTGIVGVASLGVVTDTPNGVSCVDSPNCISVHQSDPNNPIEMNLVFTRDNGTRFVSWVNNSGNPTGVCENASETTCTFNLIANTTVKAQIRYSACNDGLDNDNDGLFDLDDPGCSGLDDDDESNPTGPQCSDGIDNDDPEDDPAPVGDGTELADIADPGCHSDGDPDSDGDGVYDLDSYTPNKTSELDEPAFRCSDGEDNDGDGTCDYMGCIINGESLPADPSCGGNPFSEAEGEDDDIREI